MRRRTLVARVSATLLVGALIATIGLQAASASSSGRIALAGTAAPAAARAHPVSSVSASSVVDFQLVLQMRNQSAAQALVRAVSTPGSSGYRHYLTAAQWEARFSPSSSQVQAAVNWLRSEHFTVGSVAKDRLTISASGTAAQVESAFSTTLENYSFAGNTLRLAATNISVPTSIAASVVGAMGINQVVMRTAVAGSAAPSANAASPSQDPPAPSAFITHPPCGSYYDAESTTLSPPFGHGYSATVPDIVCGYKPGQLRSAYGVTSTQTGAGTTVAIVDAYDSATIASDAAEYFADNDPSNSFANADFTQVDQTPFNYETLCGASGWLTEQAIDIEAVHSMARDANILFVGAQNCLDSGLFVADQYIVDNGLANVITNSWGDPAGDLVDDLATRTAFDDLFMMADSTGISVLYSSGDWDDNFPITGVSAPTYPASSPYVTGVGGTTLKIGSNGQRIGELGWNTGRAFLCSANAVGELPGCTSSKVGTWLPASFDGTSGGYTSYVYAEPWYQTPVVPAVLADRNENSAVAQVVPARVVPDISLDADPGTGFLIGLTEQFPDGTTQYGQTRYGGTSLASPLLAGVVADTDQVAGVPVGFVNPAIYRMDVVDPKSIMDILPESGLQANFREDYADMIVAGTTGVFTQLRELYWPGPEVFCDATGNCESRPQTLTVTKGYDSLTGLGSPGTGFITELANY